MRTVAIVPALNEAATVAEVIRRLAAAGIGAVVVDGGSQDGTPDRARAAGATVVTERRRGYGQACQTGVAAAHRLDAEIICFVDAALAEDPSELPALLAPIAAGEADLVLGTRTQGRLEPGALRPLQRVGNRLATALIAGLVGHVYSDLGSMRAIRRDALAALQMRETAHGWPVEMQVRAARAGLRIREVPISYRRRRHGQSKVSGSVAGSLRAGAAILRVVLVEAI